MSRWKAICGAIIAVNLELLSAIHTLQCRESLQGHFRSTSHKLQELGSLSLVETTESSPEPLNL